MRDALGKTGVPMVHSIHWNYADTPGPGCQRGVDCPLPATANMWRVGGDIGPSFGSVLRLLDINANHSAAAGPGSWNDMDMLEVRPPRPPKPSALSVPALRPDTAHTTGRKWDDGTSRSGTF